MRTTVVIPAGFQVDMAKLKIDVVVGTATTVATHVVSEVPNRIKLSTRAGVMVFENGTLPDLCRANAIKKSNVPLAGAIADSMVDPVIALPATHYTGTYKIPMSLGAGPIDIEFTCNQLETLFPTTSGVTVTMLWTFYTSEDDGSENMLIQAQRFVAQPNPEIKVTADEFMLIAAASMASASMTVSMVASNISIEPSANQMAQNEAEYSSRISGETDYVQNYYVGQPCKLEIKNPSAVTFTAISFQKVR